MMDGMTVAPFVDEVHTPFVLSTWLESFHDSYWAGAFGWNRYGHVYREHLAELMGRPTTEIRILVNREMPDLFIGWVATQRFSGYRQEYSLNQPTLHYVYVKRPYRQCGVCKALLADAGISPKEGFRYTFSTKDWERVIHGVDEQSGRVKRTKKIAWVGARHDPTLSRYIKPPETWREHVHDSQVRGVSQSRTSQSQDGELSEPREYAERDAVSASRRRAH
jgi:hypothetical protein